MNQLTVCIFPESVPREDQIVPLVQTFGKVVHLQAVEDEPLIAPSPAIVEMLQHGHLRLVTPVPLGERRDGFLALVRDMEQRGDDYLSQLARLTLANLHHHTGSESGSSILSSLLQHATIGTQEDEETTQRLWQSRLVLKLGELFDAEQAGVDKAMRDIDRRQDALLQELRQESDDLFTLTDNLEENGRYADTMLSHRLKAWTRLFFHRPAPLGSTVFVTAHSAALDTLVDWYEAERHQSSRQFLSLELPATNDTFEVTNAPLIEACPSLEAALTPVSVKGENMAARLRQGAAEWAARLDEIFPQGRNGRGRLDLFAFRGISARHLFLAAFAGEHPFPDDSAPQEQALTLVGTLTTA